jgi:ribonuclease HI
MTTDERNILNSTDRLPEGRYILIHYDGSCFVNPGPGGHAAVLRRMHGDAELRRMTVRGHEAGDTTNVRMEMTAAAAALEAIKPGEAETIVMYGDSSLVRKGMMEQVPNWERKGWKNSDGKPVANRDLWERLIAASEAKFIEWRWVKGHTGDPRNEEVDRLAKVEMQTARAASFGFAA